MSRDRLFGSAIVTVICVGILDGLIERLGVIGGTASFLLLYLAGVFTVGLLVDDVERRSR